jgi:uncharacterized membrane protein
VPNRPTDPSPPPDDDDRPDAPSGTGEPLPPPSLRDAAGTRPDAASDPDHVSLVGVSFERALRAQEFLLAMRRLREDGVLDLEDAVLLVKDRQGKVKVTETIDPTPGRAAFSGAAWTGLLGLLLGGPVGWLAGLGVGAGAGAVAAKLVDLGIPDDWVTWFKQAVRPGTATVVVLLAHIDVPALAREAERFPGADLVHTTLPPTAYSQLAAAFEGRDPR